MRAAGGGSVVNLGSIDSVTGTSLTSAYTMSKFALRGLTKVTALENARFGVRANIVCPAAGNWEMHPPVVGWEDLERPPHDDAAMAERGPDAVAPAVVYFASDESRLCNGTELVLDGGQTRRDARTAARQALRLPRGIGEPWLTTSSSSMLPNASPPSRSTGRRRATR